MASVLAGTSRVSTSAPELVIVDFVAQHAVEPQDEFAGHGDDRERRVFASLEVKVEAAEIVVTADGVVSSFDEQEAQETVALFGDVPEALGIAAGAFFGIQAAVSGDASSTIEARDRIESVDDGQSSEQADAGMGTQADDAGIGLRALFECSFDGQELFGQGSEQEPRVLALNGESTGERKSRELLLAASGEKFGAEAQAMVKSNGLEAIAQHGADAHQPMTVAQQRENFAAGQRGNVDSGKFVVEQQIEQELRITTVVFLPAAGELANGQSVAHQQLMTELLHGAMEPQRITGSFHADTRGSWESGIKRTHIVTFVIERELVLLSVGVVNPAESLRADMQIHSDVHCHLRLLSKPKPNDSG